MSKSSLVHEEVAGIMGEIANCILSFSDEKDINSIIKILNTNAKGLTLQTRYIENGFMNLIRLSLEGSLSVKSASTIKISEGRVDDLLLSLVASRRNKKMPTKILVFNILYTFLQIVHPENADKLKLRKDVKKLFKLIYKDDGLTINQLKKLYGDILFFSFHFMFVIYNFEYDIVIHRLVKEFDRIYKGLYDAKKHGS